MSDEPLVPTFVPPLITLLANLEDAKGSPLTQAEVEEVRDRGVCIMLPASKAAAMAEGRGYHDLDPERAWDEWQDARADLGRAGPDATA